MVSVARTAARDRTTSATSSSETSAATAAGGHHIVRFLNTSGVRMYDILLDGLIDTSPQRVRCRAAVKIGDTAYGGGIAPLGDTRRVIINNVISQLPSTRS